MTKNSTSNKILDKSFFLTDTLSAAKALLGCVVVRNDNGVIKKGKIVETEAYTQFDPACHAFRGVTKRSATLFEEGGIAYVYLIYGMYHCLNFVTEEKGKGCAVLIRALEPLENLENTNGPGKLCKALNVNKDLNKINVCTKDSGLYVLSGEKVPESQIVTTTRIGIKKGADLPWRFYVKGSPFVSKF